MLNLRRWTLATGLLALSLAEGLPAADDRPAAPDLPAGARVRLGAPRILHGTRNDAIAISHDGKLIATAGDKTPNGRDSSIRLWDTATSRLLHDLPGHTINATSLVFSSDGKQLASAGADNLVHIYDVAAAKLIHQLKGHEAAAPGQGSGIYSLAFSHDGKLLASGAMDRTVRLWDTDAGKELHKLEGHRSGIFTLAFSPDGKHLASGSQDGSIRLWDPAAGKELRAIERHRSGINSLAFAPDGKQLASAGGDGTVRLWDPATGKESRCLMDLEEDPELVERCALLSYAADGKTLLAICSEPSAARWYEPDTGKVIRQVALPKTANFMLAYSPGAALLVLKSRYAYQGGFARFVDVASGKERPILGHRSEVSAVACSPDGQLIATGGTDRAIRLWDASGKLVHLLKGPLGRVRYLTFSPDGNLLFAASEYGDSTITAWDVKSGQEHHLLRAQALGIRGLALAPDGKTLTTLGMDRTLRLWDLASGKDKELSKVEGAGYFYPYGTAFSPDGLSLFINVNNQPGLYDTATGKLTQKLPVLPQGVLGAAFSPDGSLLALESNDRAISMIEVATAKQIRQIPAVPGQRGVNTAPVFSPDGMLLATVSGDLASPTIRILEVTTGKEVRTLKGHTRLIQALAFAADGRSLVSGGGDGIAYVWELAPQGKPAADLTAKELQALVNDLGAEGEKSFQAVFALAAVPKQAIPALREKLKPVPAPDAKFIDQMIADLDSNDFVTRKKANDELEKLAELAEPALREAIKGQPPLEVRQRVESLLKRLEGQQLTAAQLRIIREMSVLEKIGSTEAREALQTMAKGAAGSRITKEAEKALARLARRPLPKE